MQMVANLLNFQNKFGIINLINYLSKNNIIFNMKKHISFPSIEQFRNVVGTINRQYNFVGLDENGEAIYDSSLPKPVLTFKGTVKLHGTNAGVCFNDVDGMWYQSRENIITPEKDNSGFAFFADANKEQFASMFAKIAERSNIDTTKNTISIYFEWAGTGIQKNVAISEIKKSAFIIGIKVTPHVETEEERKNKPAYWIDSSNIRSVENRIYNILDFKTYEIDIDFNEPNLVVNKILELTLEVEENCPVSKEFGVDGIGEGLVFSCEHKGVVYRFKSKGEKHAGKSKVKTLKSVDNEKISALIELADKVTPEWRLDQMLTNTFNLINGGELDIKRLGEYIKNVSFDVLKEDADIISDAGFEFKDIVKYVSEIAKKYFLVKYNNI